MKWQYIETGFPYNTIHVESDGGGEGRLFNPFVHKFLGRKRPLKILPTKNLFLGIDLDSMMSKIDADCLVIHFP